MSVAEVADAVRRAELGNLSFTEQVTDLAVEIEHHLKVARLHKEIYNEPFDVKRKLAEIKEAEAEQWKELSSSQASSSTAGSPTKKVSYFSVCHA